MTSDASSTQPQQDGNTTSSEKPPGAACGFSAMCKNVDWKGGFQLAKETALNPISVLSRVKEENWSVADIYQKFLFPFAAITPISQFIGHSIFGPGKIFGGLFNAVIHYFASLGLVYLIALLIKEVAAKLGGATTLENALKFVTICSLPAFFAGVCFIVPLVILALIPLAASLAGLYAFYQGIPVMAGVAEGKRLQFFCVVVVVAILGALLVQKII